MFKKCFLNGFKTKTVGAFICFSTSFLTLLKELNLELPAGLVGFPGGSDGKESACDAGDLGLIPGLGRSPGGGNGNPLQYSCLENPMDRGVWWIIVHGVAKSQTRLSD